MPPSVSIIYTSSEPFINCNSVLDLGLPPQETREWPLPSLLTFQLTV